MTLGGKQYVTAYQGGNRDRVKTDLGALKPFPIIPPKSLIIRADPQRYNFERIVT